LFNASLIRPSAQARVGAAAETYWAVLEKLERHGIEFDPDGCGVRLRHPDERQ
jgi:hypothetical protein